MFIYQSFFKMRYSGLRTCLFLSILIFFSGFSPVRADSVAENFLQKNESYKNSHELKNFHGFEFGHRFPFPRKGPDRDDFRLRNLHDLKFGKIVASRSGNSSVTINPRNGEKIVQNGAVNLGGAYSPASFEISGQQGMLFHVSFPGSVPMSAANGSDASLSDFTISPDDTIKLGFAGHTVFCVGAKLNLPANARGEYHAVLPVYINKIWE